MADKKKLSLIAFSGEFDKLTAVFTLATGAAAVGYEVNIFFTFWGLDAIKQKRGRAFVGGNWLTKIFGFMMGGLHATPTSRFNFCGAGPRIFRKLMRKNNVATLEELVEAASPRAGRIKGGFRVEVCHHQTGVHSSVCPSCSRHLDGLTQQGGECLAEHLLYTDTVGLNLPTVIACTIVRKINKEPHGN
jgi:peroxiredoxin family protein